MIQGFRFYGHQDQTAENVSSKIYFFDECFPFSTVYDTLARLLIYGRDVLNINLSVTGVGGTRRGTVSV